MLASIGIPLAVEAIKQLTGGSAPQTGAKKHKNRGRSAPQIGLPKIPPPFYSYIPCVTGQGVKKRPAKKKGKGLVLGKKQSIQQHPNCQEQYCKA